MMDPACRGSALFNSAGFGSIGTAASPARALAPGLAPPGTPGRFTHGLRSGTAAHCGQRVRSAEARDERGSRPDQSRKSQALSRARLRHPGKSAAE
jgi:hypothetical protein